MTKAPICLCLVGLMCACSSREMPALPPLPPASAEAFDAPVNPQVVDYFRAENSYLSEGLAPRLDLKRSILRELLEKQPVPEDAGLRLGQFVYSSSQESGRRQPVISRSEIGSRAESVVFDPNQILRAYPQAELGLIRIAPSHQRIAFTVDLKRQGKFELFLWDIGTQSVSQVSQEDVQDFSWGPQDCQGFFTVRRNLRAAELWHWDCAAADQVQRTYAGHNDNESLTLSRAALTGETLLARTRGSTREFFILRSVTALSPAERPADFTCSQECVVLLHPHYLAAIDHERNIHLLPRGGTHPGKLIKLPPEVSVMSAEIKGELLVMTGRRNFEPALITLNVTSAQAAYPKLPAAAEEIRLLPASPNPDAPVRAEVSSLVSPRFTLSLDSNGRIAGLPPAPQRSVHLEEAISADGTKIPISIASGFQLPREKSAPLLLFAYGAYGSVNARGYREADQILLNRGFRIAVAHTRGGGEGGPSWHSQATKLGKQRTFDDLAACAKQLISAGFTTSEKLFAYGKSAGGLAVAVTAAQNPGLFKGIVLDRPLVDVVRAVQDSTSPLYAIEQAEWGSMQETSEAENIRQFSPAERLGDFRYPAMLVITGLKDAVVPYQDVWRWFALRRKVASRASDRTVAFLHTSLSAAHESEVDTAAQAELESIIDTFLLTLASGSES